MDFIRTGGKRTNRCNTSSMLLLLLLKQYAVSMHYIFIIGHRDYQRYIGVQFQNKCWKSRDNKVSKVHV